MSFFFSQHGYDDPFITYRYAHNLTHGNGFVFNPGERVLSTTTPLFALLLAPFSYFGFDLPRVAVLIGATSIALGALFLWDMADKWKASDLKWAALALYPSFPIILSTLSSETPLYLALCLGAFAYYNKHNYTATATLAALAILARPDALLVPSLLAFHFVLTRQRPIPWRAIAIFLFLTLPWFLFAWIYFKSPIPVTLAAKQSQGLMTISQNFPQGFLSVLGNYTKHWQYWVMAGLASIGLIFSLVRKHPSLLLLAWAVLYFLAYTLLGISRYFWYYAPLTPAFIVMVGMGISAIMAWVNSLSSSFRFKRLSLGSMLLATALIILTIVQVGVVTHASQLNDERLVAYRKVGLWLKENTPPDALVGTLEVGIIGYYSQRPMLDFAGLIQPDISRVMSPTTTYQDNAFWAIDHYYPDYLVTHAGFFPNLEHEYIHQYCTLQVQFKGEHYGYSQDMDIYRCTWQ